MYPPSIATCRAAVWWSSEYMHDGHYVLFYGDRDLRVAFSKNLVAWHATGHTLASPRKDSFDRHALKLLSVANLEQGLLVLYASAETKKAPDHHLHRNHALCRRRPRARHLAQ